MTGWCRRCGAAVRVRHTRGTRLADCRCSCGGELAATVTVARALGVQSHRVHDVSPEERVTALTASRASEPEDTSPDKERESFGA